MSFLAASLVGLLAASAAPDAAASTDDTASDVRCLVVTMRASGSADPKAQTAGMIGTMYFLGRLDGRAPSMDLEGQIVAQMNTMGDDVFRAEAHRCGEILIARGKATADMGHDLVKKGQQMMQFENSR